MPSPYAPDEPEANIIGERGLLVAISLAMATWGVLLTLVVQCVSVLYAGVSRRGSTKTYTLLIYVLLMFSLGTTAIFCHLHWVQEFLIDNRNFPGGPLAYDATHYANAVNVTGVVCYFVMNWMADGLLLWRLYIIFSRRALIIAFPLMMYLTAVGLSIVDLHTLAQPGNSEFTHSAINFGLLYWSFSIALNVIVTAAIVGRLLITRSRISRLSIEPHHGIAYISISAMLIESAALYSITAIIFLIGYSLQNELQNVAEAVQVIQGVAPLMIILRVARGTSVDDSVATTYATSDARTLRFARAVSATADSSSGAGGQTQLSTPDTSVGYGPSSEAISSLRTVHLPLESVDDGQGDGLEMNSIQAEKKVSDLA
ncbi:unnamed protein product [Peniophora sp. CBMAI 1063]|nr:unnamed protein product [Peniophora sp. CBMAI 1063]